MRSCRFILEKLKNQTCLASIPGPRGLQGPPGPPGKNGKNGNPGSTTIIPFASSYYM